MKKVVLSVGLIATLALGGCAASLFATATPTASQTVTHYVVTLAALNDSGVTGAVTLTRKGNILSVTVTLAGATPNQPHMQHIHGSHDATATCPTAAVASPNGVITLAAGTPYYGPVALPLEPTPTADATGNIRWTDMYAISSTDDYAMAPLTQHVVLIHGMMYNGAYDQVMPAACGTIRAAK
jgi:hypothetical protein